MISVQAKLADLYKVICRAAKRVKGNKGGAAPSKGGSKPSGNAGHPNYKSAGEVKEGCVTHIMLHKTVM